MQIHLTLERELGSYCSEWVQLNGENFCLLYREHTYYYFVQNHNENILFRGITVGEAEIYFTTAEALADLKKRLEEMINTLVEYKVLDRFSISF